MNHFFFFSQGIDIISADLHGHSTKITDESEARERYMKLDQHARYTWRHSRTTVGLQSDNGRTTVGCVFLKEYVYTIF